MHLDCLNFPEVARIVKFLSETESSAGSRRWQKNDSGPLGRYEGKYDGVERFLYVPSNNYSSAVMREAFELEERRNSELRLITSVRKCDEEYEVTPRPLRSRYHRPGFTRGIRELSQGWLHRRSLLPRESKLLAPAIYSASQKKRRPRSCAKNCPNHDTFIQGAC